MYTWKCTREIHDLWGLYYTILIPINDSMQYTSDCMVSLVYIDQKKKKKHGIPSLSVTSHTHQPLQLDPKMSKESRWDLEMLQSLGLNLFKTRELSM